MLLYCDYANRWAMGFQDPASTWMYSLIDLHDRVIFYLIILLFVVLGLLTRSLFWNINIVYKKMIHGNTLELIWTQTPAIILFLIGYPSLKQLYLMDEIVDPVQTVKVIGHQWYINAINKSSLKANIKKIQKSQDNNYKKKESCPILNPYWVTGFTDAEGCFSVNMHITAKKNRYISPSFKIAQDIKDVQILYAIKQFFNQGTVRIHNTEAKFEIIGDFQKVISHFDCFPLVSKKKADYLLWKEIVMQKQSGNHLTLEGYKRCLSLKASLNKGLSFSLIQNFGPIVEIERPQVVQPKNLDPHWQSGFTAGDGSFFICISKNKNCKTGYQVQASLNIGQHLRDNDQLKKIRCFFNCGQVYEDRFALKNKKEIKKIIIPHYLTYPLMNRKALQFQIWCEIINQIDKGTHLSFEGLQKIRIMREKMRHIRVDFINK